MTAALAGLLKMMLALLACADDGIVCHHPMMVLHPRSLTHNDDMMPLSTEASAASPAVESPTPSSAAASSPYAAAAAAGCCCCSISFNNWTALRTAAPWMTRLSQTLSLAVFVSVMSILYAL